MKNQKSTLRVPPLRHFIGVLVAAAILVGAYVYNGRFGASEPVRLKPSDLGFELQEVSEPTRTKHKHETYYEERPLYSHLAPFVASDTATVTVVDYDNDGWPDFYVNTTQLGGPGALFHNNHDGTFTDRAEAAGLARFGAKFQSLGAWFFDFDNDGFKDALILGVRANPRLMRNDGQGKFKDMTEASALMVAPKEMEGAMLSSMVPAFIDYDNDGFVDLILAAKWGDGMPNSLVDSNNGGPVMVFHNDGGKRFVPVPGNLGMNHVGFTRSIGVYDFRGTGRPDVWFANDFSPDKLYLNEGGSNFLNASASILTRNFSRNGMNADAADLDNDGHPVIYVSHIFQSFHRMAGNTLWKWIGGNSFQELSRERGVNRCGWSWGGKFVDLNNDGALDLVVGNGFISQNPNKNYWYFMSVMSASDRKLVQNPKNWPPIKDASLAGYQKACVYLNDGRGHFRNVVNLTSMADDLSDERGLALIDYMNDGSQSLIFANQNQPLKFYRVVQKNDNAWIGFKLRGTKSTRDALGARIQLRLGDGRVLTRQLQNTNGYGSQSDDRLHFGLGRSPSLAAVEVRWPSGLTQTFTKEKFALNRYHNLVEGQDGT